MRWFRYVNVDAPDKEQHEHDDDRRGQQTTPGHRHRHVTVGDVTAEIPEHREEGRQERQRGDQVNNAIVCNTFDGELHGVAVAGDQQQRDDRAPRHHQPRREGPTRVDRRQDVERRDQSQQRDQTSPNRSNRQRRRERLLRRVHATPQVVDERRRQPQVGDRHQHEWQRGDDAGLAVLIGLLRCQQVEDQPTPLVHGYDEHVDEEGEDDPATEVHLSARSSVQRVIRSRPTRAGRRT
jgi:hypothetical protein